MAQFSLYQKIPKTNDYYLGNPEHFENVLELLSVISKFNSKNES